MENPLVPGRLLLSEDPGAIVSALACNMQVIVLADVNQENEFPGCILLSNLLPPADVISEFLDQNIPVAVQKYKAYLASANREETVVVILAALNRGKHLLMYCDLEPNREFHILEIIQQFFAEAFGICLGVYGNPAIPPTSVDTPDFRFSIADLLFSNNFIDIRTYVRSIPLDAVPSLKSCSLILQSLNFGFDNTRDAMNAVLSIINDLRNEMVTGRVSPIVFVTPKYKYDPLDDLYKKKVEAQVQQATN